jgi:hypothetical protein
MDGRGGGRRNPRLQQSLTTSRNANAELYGSAFVVARDSPRVPDDGRLTDRELSLIRGDQLTTTQRRQVFDAFGYRWTAENEQRARQWLAERVPMSAPTSDEEWIRAHAFHCTESGAVMLRHAEPASLAPHV